MLRVLDGIFSLAVIALALGAMVISVAKGYVRRYFFVNLYVAVMLLADGLRYAVLYRYGYDSWQYFYTFFLTDTLLVAAVYLLILSFFEVIFGGTPLRGYVRSTLLFFVIIVGLMSYAMISRSLGHYYSHLIVEFLQNMYFAAVLLSVLLWISLQHLRLYDRQMAFLIAGLGLSLGAQAANCALQNLLPQATFLHWDPLLARVPALTAVVRLGLWCYALARVAQDVPVAGVERQRLFIEAEAKGSG